MQAEVIKNKKVGSDYYYMKLKTGDIDDSWQPGRFLHIKLSAKKTYDPLLRRPFSLFDINRERGIFDLLYCVVGRGTKMMTDISPGEKIDFIGPLGNGFSLPQEKEILVIGGGMGTAPLFYLCRKLTDSNKVTFMLGGNDCTDVDFFEKKFGALKLRMNTATIDGSRGFHGNVIQLCREKIKDFSKIDFLFTCGPKLMLQAVKKMATAENITGEVSLEERMGCGLGVCLSCVCDTDKGNQRVCQEGPVFALDEVIFDE